jgi:hypothetical protein
MKQLLEDLKRDIISAAEEGQAEAEATGNLNYFDGPGSVIGMLSRAAVKIRQNGRGHILDTLASLLPVRRPAASQDAEEVTENEASGRFTLTQIDSDSEDDDA